MSRTRPASPTPAPITATGAGFFNETGATFTNTGLLAIGAGGTAALGSTTYSNTGTITVASGGTLNVGGSLTLAQLGNVVVTPGGVVDLTGTLDLGGGTLDVLAGGEFGNTVLSGTIKNGTIKPDGGTLAITSGTLVGDTVLGPLVLASNVYVSGGLTAETAAGGLPGTVTLTGVGTQLLVTDTETLDNVTIAMTNYAESLNSNGAGTLTLGSHATLTTSPNGNYDYLSGGTVINRGQIVVNNQLQANATNVTNAGTITATGTADFYENGTTFTNTGLLAIGAGATAELRSTSYSNTGTITIASGGTLNAGGTTTIAALGSIVAATGGVVNVTGTLDLGGGTLSLAPGSAFANLELTGTIKNGTINENGGSLISNSGTFTNVTFVGPLVETPSSYIYASGGLTVTGAGSAPGTIDLSRGQSYGLNVLDNETIDNTTIILGSGTLGASTTLTLGAHALVTENGGSTTIYANAAGASIVNAGTVSLTDASTDLADQFVQQYWHAAAQCGGERVSRQQRVRSGTRG